jgi:hypothetical protein
MEPTIQGAAETPYPVQFTVAYPDRDLDRLRTAFRLIIAIPILIVLATVSGGEAAQTGSEHATTLAIGAGGSLFFGPF